MEDVQLRIFPQAHRTQAGRDQVMVSGYLSPVPPRPSTASRPVFASASIPQVTYTQQSLILTVVKHTRSTEFPKPQGGLMSLDLRTLSTQTPRNALVATIATMTIHEEDTIATTLTELMTEIIPLITVIHAVLALNTSPLYYISSKPSVCFCSTR